MTNKLLFYPNNYYIVLYYIIIAISFNYHLLHHFYYIFQLSFIPIFVSLYYVTVLYNHVILSYYCVSNFSFVNTIADLELLIENVTESNDPVQTVTCVSNIFTNML